MANLPARSLLRLAAVLRSSYICPRCRYYATSSPTSSPTSPLLLKLRTDLKTAMKEKDTARLNVLRGILAEVTNAAKTSSPITTDMQLLSLLRKRLAAAKAAAEEFHKAGREDLVEQEGGQVRVLDEYAGSIETMSEDDIRATVTALIAERKSSGGATTPGEVLKQLLSPGGRLDGKPVEKAQVAKLVKETLSQA